MDKFDLHIVTGNLGTGKTTTCNKIEQRLGVPSVEPDTMRKELGITVYKREDTSRVMQAVWDRVIDMLCRGEQITLCTPYVSRYAREHGYQMLRKLSDWTERELQAALIRCDCSEATSKARIQDRGGFHMPPFNSSAYDRVKATDEPLTPDETDPQPNISFLKFDTERNLFTPLSVRENHHEAIQRLMAAILS